MTALEATGLGRRYGRQWALRDCSLRLPTGRVIALVGPNGAGKTTLLQLAVGLLTPSQGSIRVLGCPPAGWARSAPEVGFVAQDHPLYRGFTVADLLRMGAALNSRWDSAVATSRLTQLGIPLNLAAGKLSGGQQAQVALALALARRPRLLILDEPVASLDPLARRDFMAVLMGTVAEEGITVLLSSHLVEELERVCDYLVVLSRGQVQVDGDMAHLLASHRLLTGPRRPQDTAPGGGVIVRASHTDRQSTLLVRGSSPIRDPAWHSSEVSLEELVLAYLREPEASVRPGPALADAAQVTA